MAEYQLQPLP